MSDEGISKTRGYIICTECGGYYHLQEDESPSDFSSCECGGSLEYYDTLEDFYEEELDGEPEETEGEPMMKVKGLNSLRIFQKA